MTKVRWLAVAALALLLVPLADAHGAPKPREYQTRLLGDCIDDAGVGDDFSGPGYDLHSLDVWEAWDGSKDMTWFRLVLNGGGSSDITVELTEPAKSFGWSTSNGNTWSITGFSEGGRRDDVWVANDPNQGQDGNRFALVGAVPSLDLGGKGAKLDGYTVRSDDNGANDAIPGKHGLGSNCDEPFERRDYQLAGPARYARLDVDGNQALLSDTSNFVDVQVASLLTLDEQVATLAILGHTGDATVRFHDPSSSGDGYTASPTIDLGKRGGAGGNKIIHLAVEGPAGASGSLTVELTTDLGGRVLAPYTYSIPEDDVVQEPVDNDAPSDESQGSPGPALPAAVLMLALAARRR